MKSVKVRLLEKVLVNSKTKCWIWTSQTDNGGYGKFWFERKCQLAHRVSYIIFVGPIPELMTLDHYFCNTPGCINPVHLKLATQRQNILRGNNICARNARKTHCSQGHEFEFKMENGRERRICRICARESARRRWRERNK